MSKVIKKQVKPSLQNKVKLSNQKITELQNVRIMQKNLVYVIGLSTKISNSEILSQKEYFGQYGKITRLVVNNTKAYTGTNIPSYSAYITYSTIQEAALAILAIDYTMHDSLLIRASFGSTKYCSHFLRNIECNNKECLYYHYFVDDKEIINNKDDNTINNKRQALAFELGDIFSQETKNKIFKTSLKNAVFPTLESIYKKDMINEQDYNRRNTKHNHSSNNISGLKSILNKEKSPKTFKEDLNGIFSKKKTTKENNNSSTILDTNESSNYSNSRYTSSPNEEKIITHTKNNSADLTIEKNVHDNNTLKKSSLFKNKNKSRFAFASEEENMENVDVPSKINEIINKRTSTYYFLKNIDLNIGEYEEYIIKNCDNIEWIDFMLNIKKESVNK